MKHAILTKVIAVMFLLMLTSSAVGVFAQTTSDDDHKEDDPTTVSTDDSTDDSPDNETETETEVETENEDDHLNDREVQVQTSSSFAEINSKLESGSTEDSFKIEVQTSSEGLKFKISFESEVNSTESGTEFEVKFDKLIEFNDTNGNNVYDKHVDYAIQILELNSFNPIDYSVVNSTDGLIHIFDVMTTDGIFTSRIYAAGNFADINGTVVAPTQVKIDVIINGFNFMENDSLLALHVKFESASETSYDNSTEDEEDGRASGEAEVASNMGDISGFFSWKETADIDGVTYAVSSSFDEIEGSEQGIYLNYPQGELIIHDPKVGFENLLLSSPTSNTSLLPDLVLPLALVGVVALLGIVIVKRR